MVYVIAEVAATKQSDPVASCSSTCLSVTEKNLNFFGVTLDSTKYTSSAATGIEKMLMITTLLLKNQALCSNCKIPGCSKCEGTMGAMPH